MKISQLSLEGRGAWPDLQVDSLHRQLNVFYGAPQAGKSTIARLLGQLLYGKTDSLWRKQFAQTIPLTEGQLTVASSQGSYILRRHRDPNQQEKLTIASTDGNLVDSQTMRCLVSNLAPELTSRLFAVDFAEAPPVEWLLSDNFGRLYAASQLPTQESTGCSNHPQTTDATAKVDRRRVEELVARRDAVAKEIEQQLSLRRQESGILEQELKDLDHALTTKREQREALQDKLRTVQRELAEVEVRLRYFSLEASTQLKTDTFPTEQRQQELDELEAEITRCRQSLSDLQIREATVRKELAKLTADGTADTVTCLEDGRATLSVMERLLDDLDAEVAQIARADQPGRCVSHETHARLSPVAEMLRMQVYTLCGQLTEQERIARRQQYSIEARQLSRALTDLGERLEQLLSRRESIIQQSRLVGQPVMLMPQPPANEHCDCERHGQFVDTADVMQLGGRDRRQFETLAKQRRKELESQRINLSDKLATIKHQIDQLEYRWKILQSERAGLIGGVTLEENQQELDRLEKLIAQALEQKSPFQAKKPNVWRASDVLAQLTDGQLVQIRLRSDGGDTTIVDHTGQRISIESLSPAHHDAVYLALTLALVSSYANGDIQLPLVLDEPFLRQDASATAIMAGVLEEFARAGHQLFVFTEDRQARRRFESLNSTIYDLEKIRSRPVAVPEHPIPTKTEASTHINTRIVRQSLNGATETSHRLTPTDDSDYLFYLSPSSSFEEFPILGERTSKIFAAVHLHTIGDLLAGDAEKIAKDLQRNDITVATVRLWQSHMSLMCFVPEVTINDAQILSAAGVASPEAFRHLDLKSLADRLESFFASSRGLQFSPTRNRYSQSQLNDWLDGARKHRERWDREKQRYGWLKVSSNKKHDTAPQSTRSPSPTTSEVAPEYYLDLSSDVEAAPSIGPKTAKRLANLDIHTVADLIAADAEDIAEQLEVSHISAATITRWQQQAQLVCCIPRLLGYGAQLFVACGYTDPEQIANDDAETIVQLIHELCQTKKGQRILRGSEAPSRGEVLGWVEATAHMRPLEAA